ncbi:sensor histidine kinase [Deinococcus yavapaiensis]|uniref:histidine kinase n=1 Tax=Deinococcus yavapaiensis KR-236 TaxID=694435 RepID=A0A318SHW3_9DEIO|nr:ATP-binding protein [Deinococcus yavapaiensis]PYE50962.1 PAS domain-containing protein [Deinococcus yavapaiensis KR-236]
MPSDPPPTSPELDSLVQEQGEMANRIRHHDWASTPLGPPSTWPDPLRTYIQMMLASKHPMYLAWTHDLIALYNDAYRPILGTDKHPHALGARTADIFGQDGYPGLKPVFDAAIERGESAAFENHLVPLVRHGYMEECYFDVSYTPVHVNGHVAGVFCSVTETTERVLAARRTKTLAALTATLLGLHHPDDVVHAALHVANLNPHDLPCAVVYTPNEQGELQWRGATRSNDEQMTRWQHTPPEWQTTHQAHVLATSPLAVGPWPEPVTQVAVFPLTSFEDRPLGLLVVGLNARQRFDDAYQDFLRLFRGQLSGALRDALLTEALRQRNADLARERELLSEQTTVLARERELLKEQTAALAHANEELEAFAYGVAHDLRTPLRHIASFNALLRTSLGSGVNEKSARYLQVVDQAAARMSKLIDAMLELSRTSRQPLRMGLVDFGALVASVREELEAEAPERPVTWHVEPLPLMLGDSDLLRQVMLNLLANAVKYTRVQARAVIEVRVEEHPEEWRVLVRDNGVGFDSKYADKLFNVFQRLHRQEDFEGTGVGLANVRRIVHRHGGRVWAEGMPNEGATFGFTLPK